MLFDPNWKETKIEKKKTKVQQVLLDAAKIIEEKGWARGKLQAGRGYCAIGALQRAVYGRASYHLPANATTARMRGSAEDKLFAGACSKLLRYLSERVPVSIQCWNDVYATKDEVISTLRKAAGASGRET